MRTSKQITYLVEEAEYGGGVIAFITPVDTKKPMLLRFLERVTQGISNAWRTYYNG